ncbi:N-formylglutamate amidohydrolase [Coralloluteibacterium thermophilus]|uniref:N-formylglutamate amidohydrolase n=1 Tax=Coralloluteibacterium thermophilum TaxID=2707049 RepID=A0ABV9NJU8_9GAMM
MPASHPVRHAPSVLPGAHARLAERRCDDWEVHVGNGPVVATAIHDGHQVRESVLRCMRLSADERRREEDPLTGVLTTVADSQVRVRTSRFQTDMNRPRALAVPRRPEDTWGLDVWRTPLPETERARCLADYDRFYADMRALMDGLLETWDSLLVLDIHSYNHRRDGADAPPAAADGNPEIDLGVTTLDRARHGGVACRFADALRATLVDGRHPDVRENVRYPTGGHFPEWLHAEYGDRLCVISLEYKKIYMDEWSAMADVAVLDDFRYGLKRAVDAVRGEFARCR